MTDEQPNTPDIDALLAAMAPPRIPEQGFGPDNPDLFHLRGWSKIHAATMLAGLATVPDFHANDIRLDWLLRLVLAKAEGHAKVQPAQLERALNAGLAQAKVLRAEDPVEDLFCDRIATSRGNFRIIAGRWEAPGPYTQTLLSAFEALPAGALKDRTLASVYALLSISDEIARRANLHRFTPSGGVEMGQLSVPSADSLKKISRRVVFTTDALRNLGISQEALAPFVLRQEQFSYTGIAPRGESPLELHPLIEHHNGIAVVSPTGLSLAARAIMVNAAKLGGVERPLLAGLMIAQEKYAEIAGFWNGPLSLPAPDAHFVRAAIVRTGSGRYLQVIQVPSTFEYFPQRLFSAVAEIAAEVNQAIADHVMAFYNFVGGRSDYREATTLLLTSGWGAPYSVEPPIDGSRVPRNWRFLALSFFEASVLGACADGKLRDFLRINAQKERLEADGFAFENPNGPVNLFGFWRDTRNNLIPEHMTDLEPPFGLMLPVDSLREPHIEAARRKDLQAMPYIDGTYRWVQRENWDDHDRLQPIYASLDDIVHRRLLGAIVIKERVWWLESLDVDGASREWRYRLWHAMLQWLEAIGPQLIERFPNSFPRGPRCVGLSVPTDTEFQSIGDLPADSANLAKAVVVTPAQANAPAAVAVTGLWLSHVRRQENDAEVELVAAILDQLAAAGPSRLSRDALRGTVKASIGSQHWRWTHAGVALTPLDRMGAQGLLGSFKAIPKSALAFARCGSIWRFYSRAAGVEIVGEVPCMEFLARYRASMLDALIDKIRAFNRTELVLLAAGRYQGSRHEQSSWRRAIRAMRAIQGKAADQHAFERQSEMNAVQRAAKSVMEIAACEAQANGGVSPDQHDLDDLFATALLLLGNGQLLSSIRAGLVEPRLKISPAGDLLSNRSLVDATMRPGAEWKNTQTLDEADQSYGRDRSLEIAARQREPLDTKLRAAIEAEYQIAAEAFVDLQYAVVAVALAARQEVLFVHRSELARALAADASFSHEDLTPLLSRLTLSKRESWREIPADRKAIDFDLSRFDRAFSLIGRPLLALDDDADPTVLVAPLLVSDSTMYSLSGLMDGSLQNQFWTSDIARRYVGEVAAAAGPRFEESVAEKVRGLGLRAWVRCKLSWALNQKVGQELGDVDVLAVSPDGRRVWVIEAKNLRLCRSEIEVASRLYEYRGRTTMDRKGKEVPDALLRHIRRVRYLRERNEALCHRLELQAPPDVRGLLVVDSPQPMNFHMLEKIEDAESAFLGAIDKFKF